MQPGGFDWVPQSRLDTSQILSGSRRRSSKPELFTYKEMPRNYVRGSTKSRTTENTNIGESGDDDGHGANGASCGSGGTSSSSPRSDVKNKKRKQRKDKNENGRNADMGQGTGERYGKKRSSKEIVGDSPRRTKAAAAVAETLRGEHGRLVGSAAMTSNPSSSISLLRTAGGDRYRDTDADTDITGTATDVELDAAETISTCSTSSKFPLGSVIDSSRISISARRKSSPRPYRWSSRRTGERSPVMLTYVTHEQPDASEDDTEANLSPGGREAAGGNGANATPSTLRRYKRRRPLVLPGGSARAVVWSDPCPVCRGEGPTSAVKEGDALATSSVSNGTPHASFLRGVGGGGQGDGPARPGQYVYLRNAASEDVRRSLISEGEFAAPRSGGLFDGALAGERIRVWRNHGVDGGIRTFAEADVVQFNSTSGKHRVRFVHDGAVEDVKLTKAEAEHGSCTGEDQERSGSGEVRWLQRRTRLRNRDTVRRNAAGLCEGPGGEMRGLVGDEHDPVAQRRENWRWAMSRWRWECGERDGYSTGGRQEEGSGISGVVSKVRDARSFEERSGVPPAGDGMFPPIGKVLAVERRLASTGEKREGPDAVGLVDRVGNGGDGSATETFLKVARLWYPQDTWSGMDPFVHGKAEVFEACRVVRGSGVDGAEKRKTAQDRGVGVECVCGPRASCSCGSTSPFNRKLTPVVLANDYADTGGVRTTAMSYVPVGCSRLDSGQPLGCCLQLEPVTLWVKACEVRRLASVHPCLDGRLNPCAGKVVNDPYQLQAEFFLSHRYCLELDAYFPLASAKTATPMFPSPDGAFEHPGNYSPRAWSLDEGFRVNCSPRSTKARLLKRSVSDGVSCLPPKWHPLKKRMSFDHSSAEDGAGSRSCLPVIGWESALDRSTWQDYGASTSSISPTAAGTTASVTASEGQGSLLLATATPTAHHSSEIFLCHRCRHALPASSLRKCLGRGCDNRFCSPCAAGRRGSGSLGVKGSRRSLHRWPGGEIRDATSGAAGWGDIETAERKTWGDGTSVCSESPKPWIGPCCQGQCDCQNCAAGTDEGLLSGWHARNGLSYFHLPTRRNTHQGRRLEASLPVPLIPPQPSSDRVVAMQESSWQRRKLSKALHEELQLADIQDDLVRKRDWAGKEVDGAAPAANGGGQAKSAVSDITEEMGDAIDGVVEQTGIEWCSSCRGPGPTGSLTRCYYCRAGVHASGCRWFEESLSRRRLAQHGVGQNGQLAAPPRGEGAVGHGIAVCVRDRWRAGIVLGWSPVSRAHYVRYVDGAVEQGTSVADEGLEAVPWDGEWVLLSTTADFRTVFNGKSSAVGSREPEQSNQHQRTGHVGVQASDVRWPLVDVALRLFPPRADGEQAQTRQPHAPDSKPAVKVLKVIMKHTWLASLASTKTHGNAEVTDEGTHKYRPPAVALASCLGDLECDGFGDGGASDKTRTRMRPWVCLSCIEAKLQRFQRRVRSQFQSPSKVDEQPAAAAGGEVLSPRTPGTKASSASMMGAESSSSTAAAGFKADPPVSVAGRDSKFAGWLQPQRLSKTAASEKKALAGVTTPFEANVREEERYRRPVEAERRGARADRRVRWLPIGNPGSTRPFAYEVGFVSDLSEAHANGGPTATGGGTGSGVARRGKKRLRAPPVARAIAHVMARLDSQRPLAFALPHDIIGLDGDMAAFFSTQRGASGADSAAGANGNGNEIAAGLLDDGFVVEERRAVVFVSGIAAVTVAATGAVVRGGVRGTAAVSGLMPKAVSGTALGGNDVLAGGVTGVTVQVPLAFTSVKEVDLESSARIRPLDPNKHRTLTSSSRGGENVRFLTKTDFVFFVVFSGAVHSYGCVCVLTLTISVRQSLLCNCFRLHRFLRTVCASQHGGFDLMSNSAGICQFLTDRNIQIVVKIAKLAGAGAFIEISS